MVHLRSLFQKGKMSQIEEKCRSSFDNYGISSILWNVTYECGLNCKHCYVGETKKIKDELTTKQASNLIHKIGDMGIPLLFMTGGEPLLRKDIFTLLKLCMEYKINTVLSSNGLLINNELARKLKNNNIHFIAISVYGPPKVHDEIVGLEGSFEKIIKNIKECIKQEIKICFKTVINDYTYDSIPYIINKGLDLGVKSFYLCDMLETGRAKDEHKWRLSNKKWLNLAEYLFSIVSVDGEAEIDLGACPSVASLAIDYFKDKKNVGHAIQRLGNLSACPIGMGPLGISAKGDILPCIFLQNFSIGNVLEDDLKQMNNHPILKQIAQKESLKGICGECKFKFLCGGCRAKAFLKNGDIFGADYTCLLNKSNTKTKNNFLK